MGAIGPGLGVVEGITLTTPLDPYLTVRALGAYSSISVRQLRNLISDPLRPLPHHRIGGRVLVRRSDFDQWAAQHRRVGVDLKERIERLRENQGRARRPSAA